MSTNKVHKKDWRFVNVDPDPNFDEEHNRKVINGVIKDTEKIARKKREEAYEGIDERAWAVAKYFKSQDQGGRESNLQKYFGRKELARLRGESLLKNEKFRRALEMYKKGIKVPIDLSET